MPTTEQVRYFVEHEARNRGLTLTAQALDRACEVTCEKWRGDQLLAACREGVDAVVSDIVEN